MRLATDTVPPYEAYFDRRLVKKISQHIRSTYPRGEIEVTLEVVLLK
jgi:hypothetical protein